MNEFRRTVVVTITWASVLSACKAGSYDGRPAGPEESSPCFTIEVQNTSLQGVTVWIAWETSAPRRLGRLSLNARQVFTQRYRNELVVLLFARDGQSERTPSNSILPTPGDRLDVVYRETGISPLRRTGVARC